MAAPSAFWASLAFFGSEMETTAGLLFAGLFEKQIEIVASGEADKSDFVRQVFGDLDGAGADGAGGAQNHNISSFAIIIYDLRFMRDWKCERSWWTPRWCRVFFSSADFRRSRGNVGFQTRLPLECRARPGIREVCRFGNRRYSRFGNLRYKARAGIPLSRRDDRQAGRR